MDILLRVAGAGLLAVTLAPAQFRNMATTGDGNRVFFLSSLRQTGSNQHLHAKIFALDSAGVTLVLEPPAPGPSPFEQYSLDRLQAAADGSWVVYGKSRNCVGGSSCFLNEQHSSMFLPLAGPEEGLGGNARLSSDGRWAYIYPSPNVLISFSWLLDRQTGARVDLTALPRPNSVPSVARNGSVLIPSSAGLLLRDGSTGLVRTLAGPVTAATMNDDGTLAVYESGMQLRVIDLAGGQNWSLGAYERDNVAPRITADGRYVLYLSGCYNGPQLFFSAPDNAGWKQLTDEEGGIRDFALSGDGRVAWAVSASGAILRIDTFTWQVETPIGPTPRLTSVSAGAPGSANEILGAGLEGRQLLVGGEPVPVLEAGPGRILFQIPWSTPVGETELSFQSGGDFDYAFPLTLREAAPAAVRLAGCGADECLIPIAMHEDWSSPVTEANPARPGEVLHLYATGLGPVDPPLETGAAAPAEPPSRATIPFDWSWGGTPAEVLSAGLAPGTVGFYQVDVRAPYAASSPAGLFVSWNLGNTAGTVLFGFVPVTTGAAPQ